jgi:hypothetical protein
MDIDELGERIASTAASIDVATHALLVDLRAFDEAGGWARHGAASFPQWLSWRCGIDLGAAREKIRVAQALVGLPLLDQAFATGAVSFSKVRAMTRVATPDNQATLLAMARSATAAQLERICRLFRQCQREEPPEARRRFSVRDLDDGMVRLDIRLRAEEAARVIKACDLSAETRVDGLCALAEAALRGDHPDRPPVEVTVHVAAETPEAWTEAGAISRPVAERLLCDAGVVPVLADGAGQPLDVGRKTRTIPPALRRALFARDGGCRFPGCHHRRWVDAHHIRHWARGGATSLANTLLLCTFHHTLVHEGGFAVERVDSEVRFLDAKGQVVPPDGVRAQPFVLPRRPPPPPPAGDGRVDYGLAIDWAAGAVDVDTEADVAGLAGTDLRPTW